MGKQKTPRLLLWACLVFVGVVIYVGATDGQGDSRVVGAANAVGIQATGDGDIHMGGGAGLLIAGLLVALGVAALRSKDFGLRLMGFCLIAVVAAVATGHSPTELGDWLLGGAR